MFTGTHIIRRCSLGAVLAVLTSCGGGGSGDPVVVVPPPVTPSFELISISGIGTDAGNFDPAPTVDADGMVWMSYSHVSVAGSGINQIETRLAITPDGGLNWQDAGVVVNPATALALPPPADVNAIANEVSRLVYNPFALANGADPWILLWHRYLSVFDGNDTLRLFEHGWIGLKSGPTAMTLASERKLFTGFGYDPSNDADALGAPEYPLDVMAPAAMGDCVAFSEPGVLPKAEGIYVAMLCARVDLSGKIVLLRCDHDFAACNYIGDLLDSVEAITVNPAYEGYSAPELVAVGNRDYLIVTPTIPSSSRYRGCVAYRVTDLANASVQRDAGGPVASLTIDAHGDFNGACGYVPELTGSGILMREAFFTSPPPFRIFGTGEDL
jgi:hypothetical protein